MREGIAKKSQGRRLLLAPILAALCAAFAVPAHAGAATGPTQVGTIRDANSLSGTTAVATLGRYAYATGYYSGRLVALDISTPAHPTIAGTSASSTTLNNSTNVTIAGRYAYVVSKNRNASTTSNDDGTGNSLTILDVATMPAQPRIVGSIRDAVTLFGAYGIAVSSHYAFVAAQGCLGGQPCPNPNVGDSFAVIDVANPAAPTIVGSLHNASLPAPWAGTNALKHATSVAISGNYAFVTASAAARLTVIDISNPASPRIVASLRDSVNLPADVDVVLQNGYGYVADQTSPGRMTVVDLRNPLAPKVAGSTTNSLLDGAYRIQARGDFAYVSASSAATVAAIDVSNPARPRFAGSYTNTATLNRTIGLANDSTGRYLVAVSPYLTSEANTGGPYPPYPGQPGGRTATGTATTIDLDPSPISVAIAAASKPSNPTTQTTAAFTFAASDLVASVRCSLDGAPMGPCTSFTTASYAGLASGSHTFSVLATDAAGTTATDSYTWTVNAGSVAGPTTPVLDTFNRANGAVGPNWATIAPSGFAALNISGNRAVDASTTQFAWNYWKPATSGPDCEAYVTVASYGASDVIRVGGRVANAGTTSYSGYFVSVSATGAWSILRVTNAAPTTLSSGATQTLASGDKVAIRIVGPTITALHYIASSNTWAQVLTYDTSGDATRYTAAGRLALEFRSSALDDFGGGTV